jgi:acyl carrier protein
MSHFAHDDEVYVKIVTEIAEALEVDTAEIDPDSRLFLDLDAESIDILDIRFRIEHAFGFKISQETLIQSLGKELSADEIQEKLTVKSIVAFVAEQLKK